MSDSTERAGRALAALRPHLAKLYELLPPVASAPDQVAMRRGDEVKWNEARHAPALRALLGAAEALGQAVDDLTSAVVAQGKIEKELREQLAGGGSIDTAAEKIRDAHLRGR